MSDRGTAAERLEELYLEDRAEHADVPPMGTPEYDALRERDRARRTEASELLARLGGMEKASAEELYHAAWLFNHGDTPDEARRAHELARTAAAVGHERAPWLAAAAYDRWCMYEGRPQKFGTQLVPDGTRFRLWDVEPGTTDEERAAHGVPTLEEQRRRAERMTREEPQPPMELAPDWLREALDRWAAGPDSEPTIRPLEPHEIDVYRLIRREALTTDSDAFGETIQAFEAHTDEGLAAWLETHAGRPDRGVLIAEIEGTPVAMSGFGRKHDDPGEGFIWGVFVSRGARRRGIAAELLARARNALEEAGVTRITARVAAPNEGALEFYRAQGFTIGERTGMLREGSDVPVYRIEARLERDGPEEPDGR